MIEGEEKEREKRERLLVVLRGPSVVQAMEVRRKSDDGSYRGWSRTKVRVSKLQAGFSCEITSNLHVT
jgi:hypothetical protein